MQYILEDQQPLLFTTHQSTLLHVSVPIIISQLCTSSLQTTHDCSYFINVIFQNVNQTYGVKHCTACP